MDILMSLNPVKTIIAKEGNGMAKMATRKEMKREAEVGEIKEDGRDKSTEGEVMREVDKHKNIGEEVAKKTNKINTERKMKDRTFIGNASKMMNRRMSECMKK